MKVNYTLAGSLPESGIAGADGTGAASPSESFAAHLNRLRVPDVTDWKQVLRLDPDSAGMAALGPPSVPMGIDSRTGSEQRAWWRGMLQKHMPLANGDAAGYMLQRLAEYQRSEDTIFARHFAEGEN